jgi:hypothetical protein
MDYLIMGDALIPATSKRKLSQYPGRTQVQAGVEVVV